MNKMQKIIEKFKDILYPKHIKCICCGNELAERNVYDMCEKCYKAFPFIKDNFCVRCGMQFEKDGTGTCLNCKSTNYYFEKARAVAVYDNAVIKIIHNFKYSKYKFLAEPFAYLLYDLLKLQDWEIDLIAYVPLYPSREKERGYNQSRELAYQLSTLTNIPTFDDIVRLKDTPTQTHLSRHERIENVKDCFKVNNKKTIKNLNILLIDDVFTTGSTTNEISKALKQAGANKIHILTLAHGSHQQI